MFLGNIQEPNTYEKIIRNGAFLEALEWIRKMPHDQAPGIYELRGQEMFVNVHGYETLPRGECRFESHRKYVDIQYCIEGGELIDYQLSSRLTPDGDFDTEKDLQFYQGQDVLSTIHMTPGHFSIFFQEDAHRPKIADGIHPSVRKLVVKVSCDLL